METGVPALLGASQIEYADATDLLIASAAQNSSRHVRDIAERHRS